MVRQDHHPEWSRRKIVLSAPFQGEGAASTLESSYGKNVLLWSCNLSISCPHFVMQTQRGFVSAAILIAIALGLIVLGGGAYYVMQQSPSPTLTENEIPTLPASNSTSQNKTTNTITNTPTQPAAQALAGVVLVQGINRKEASVILFDSQTGAKKEIMQVPNTAYPYVPEVKVENGAMFYMSANNSISRRDMKSGQISAVPLKDFYEPWRIADFAVKGNTLVFLAIGPTDESPNEYGPVAPRQPCELRVVDMARATETKILDIAVCSQAHGPNYSIQDISSDGTTVSLFASSGEAGYASIAWHEINLASKTDTVKETVSSSPVCTQGTFYDAIECTQDVRNKNAQYDAFQKQYQLGYGWNVQCGNISVKKDEKEYYTLHINGAGKAYSVEDAGYVGCLK